VRLKRRPCLATELPLLLPVANVPFALAVLRDGELVIEIVILVTENLSLK